MQSVFIGKTDLLNAARTISRGETFIAARKHDDNESVIRQGCVSAKHLFGTCRENFPVATSCPVTAGLILPDLPPYDVPDELASSLCASKSFRGEDLMHEHGPDELIGPVRGTAAWWRGMGAEPPDPSERGRPPPKKPRKKRQSAHDPPIRTQLVARVRREIAAGTYDTEEKWEAALDRLLDRLEKED